MGSFGYMCPVCETSIRGNCGTGGELCVLIHKRKGKEIGRIVGHYNEYGGVMEDEDYRGHNATYRNGEINVNSHKEICKSEMNLEDSNAFGRMHILPDGKPFDRSDAAYNATWFLSIESRYESFKKEYPLSVCNKADDLKRGRELWFKNFNSDEALNEEDKKLRTAFLNADCELDDEMKMYMIDWIANLPKLIPSSGTVAVHKKCYDSLSDEEQKALPISKHDPDQSWGKVRKKYC